MDVDQRVEGLVAQLKELKLKDLPQRQTVNSDDTHNLLRVPVATVLTEAHALITDLLCHLMAHAKSERHFLL